MKLNCNKYFINLTFVKFNLFVVVVIVVVVVVVVVIVTKQKTRGEIPSSRCSNDGGTTQASKYKETNR